MPPAAFLLLPHLDRNVLLMQQPFAQLHGKFTISLDSFHELGVDLFGVDFPTALPDCNSQKRHDKVSQALVVSLRLLKPNPVFDPWHILHRGLAEGIEEGIRPFFELQANGELIRFDNFCTGLQAFLSRPRQICMTDW